MQNNHVIYAPYVVVAGLILNLSGCNRSKADQQEATVQSISIDSTFEDVAIPEVVDNTSDVYFERAVSATSARTSSRAQRGKFLVSRPHKVLTSVRPMR